MGQPKENPEPESLATGGSGLQEDPHKKRIEKLSAFKQTAIDTITEIKEIASDEDSFWIHALKPIHSCSNYLVFRHHFDFKGPEKVYPDQPKLYQVFTCKRHLICPVCALLRQGRLHHRLLPIVKQILSENPDLTPYHLTLTVKNQEFLPPTFNNLIGGLRDRFTVRRHQRSKPRFKQHTEFSKIEGALYAVEVKRGSKSNLWHPHIHMLILCKDKPYVINREELYNKGLLYQPEKLPKNSLNWEWYQLTGGVNMNMDEIKPGEDGSLFDALCEVVKYGIKPGELCTKDIMTVYSELSGKRLLGTIGNLRGVKIPDAGPDEDISDSEMFDEYFYRFIKGSGYVKEKTSTYAIMKKREEKVPF
jgi:plasmid rolling circle replication initiator protein Rep